MLLQRDANTVAEVIDAYLTQHARTFQVDPELPRGMSPLTYGSMTGLRYFGGRVERRTVAVPTLYRHDGVVMMALPAASDLQQYLRTVAERKLPLPERVSGELPDFPIDFDVHGAPTDFAELQFHNVRHFPDMQNWGNLFGFTNRCFVPDVEYLRVYADPAAKIFSVDDLLQYGPAAGVVQVSGRIRSELPLDVLSKRFGLGHPLDPHASVKRLPGDDHLVRFGAWERFVEFLARVKEACHTPPHCLMFTERENVFDWSADGLPSVWCDTTFRARRAYIQDDHVESFDYVRERHLQDGCEIEPVFLADLNPF